MSDWKKAQEEADERYRIDYQGILLNSAISILSSTSATAITSALTTIPMSQLPVVAVAIFAVQVLPKILIEVHKAHIRNKAIREGYSQGLLRGKDIDDDSTNSKSKTLTSFISVCERMSYY